MSNRLTVDWQRMMNFDCISNAKLLPAISSYARPSLSTRKSDRLKDRYAVVEKHKGLANVLGIICLRHCVYLGDRVAATRMKDDLNLFVRPHQHTFWSAASSRGAVQTKRISAESLLGSVKYCGPIETHKGATVLVDSRNWQMNFSSRRFLNIKN
jgi:hypothetical protein